MLIALPESVADITRRPLYTVSCGELGVHPGEVESNLQAALKLATTWNAIVLIDEADVFLEQRGTHDLERNSLVSSKYDESNIRKSRSVLILRRSFSSTTRVLRRNSLFDDESNCIF
jgi:hypothetical protein